MPVAAAAQEALLAQPVLILILLFVSISCPCVSSLATSRTHNTSEADRQALLCLRSQFSDPLGALDSWRKESLAFCDWHGVTCSNQGAARVVALRLESLNLTGQIPSCIADLSFLTAIYMPDNQISGHIPPEIGRLTQLRNLSLGMNSITGMIPDTISSCTHLEVIDMWSNNIEGEIPSNLANCSLLQEITLSHNNLNGTIPPGIGSLPNLKYLFLANNKLVGSIPKSLGSRTSLSMVVLAHNSLTGSIPPILANCSSLRYLDLSQNKLGGVIPSALFNSSSLLSLDLSSNNFIRWSIPSAPLISAPIQRVILTNNTIFGGIPAELGNLSSLSSLLVAQNNLQGNIPDSITKIPYLQELDLAYNNLTGTVPPSLYTISTLTYLGLGVNNLFGRIPTNIGYTLPNIETLILEGNHFDGPLPTSLVNALNLQVLEVRDNTFTGVVPSFWALQNLTQLDLGANLFESVDWTSLSSKINSTKLVAIYLDNNRIHGILPSSIGNLPGSLQTLYMTNNRIAGTIPSEIGNLNNLTLLHLAENLISGDIPETLSNLVNLFVLGLHRNNLSGEIPQSIGKLEKLGELYLQENNFSGAIPSRIGRCKNLVMLNLSCNTFNGIIPPELLSISSLSKGLDLSYNGFSGPIPSEIGSLINLDSINISNNQLSGEIPHTLGECLHLESLQLEVNFLNGSIPDSFTSLRGINEMDLSQNNLSGEIPKFFETFSSLQLLNLSFNNLEGMVPTYGVFSNSSKVFVQGNRELCTWSSMLQLPLCTSTSSKTNKKSYIIPIVVPLASAATFLMICVATFLYKKRNNLGKQIDQSCKEWKFTYAEIAKATNEFSSDNLVGSGAFGVVYIGRFKIDAEPVAIKVFKLDEIGASNNFLAECEVLRNTRHRNLMHVISLCSSFDPMGKEFKALILEYMANGNLESWLHPKVQKHRQRRPLGLGSIIQIATDIAAALDYLHNWCTPPLVHCDLKPSNVLLDEDMVAHVSDFGLAKFICNHPSGLNSLSSIAGPRGSVGYIAPEYGMGCQISTAGDVYSYGVILLEMLTGKHPTDDMFKDGLNIHKLVDCAYPHNVVEILEASIIPWYTHEGRNHDLDNDVDEMSIMERCITQMLKIGLECSLESPGDRPLIQDVYAEITKIKETFSALDS
ncbi:probable LRR receptor-like serine/threonine-protein kinase At3g47570 [Oryza glaberrima]|uniref:probable LRR receptor-like serine/threonine-protein kinase At3g47570 n=1 Tax=Oryza glaberrima TaxID=4538 RepID=UPI00023DFAFD|nr:probable LRR receptor-like serine/threonine-protein kinase At3g47570 [Oryza glaberrima]